MPEHGASVPAVVEATRALADAHRHARHEARRLAEAERARLDAERAERERPA